MNSEILKLLNQVNKNVRNKCMDAVMKSASIKFSLMANNFTSKIKKKTNSTEYHKKVTPLKREFALAILTEYPDGLKQKDLSDQLGINASSTSELVNKLEEDRYLKKLQDPNDKRVSLLILTELGQKKADIIKGEKEKILDQMFGPLNEEEKEELIRILKKIV